MDILKLTDLQRIVPKSTLLQARGELFSVVLNTQVLKFCLNFFQSKTSPTFIEHVVQIHPRARHVIEDLINLKRHQIDTKAVGSELQDHSSILEDVEDYINYDLSREGSDYVPSSEDEGLVNDENIDSGKANSSPKGQVISKCLFGVIISTKIATKILP